MSLVAASFAMGLVGSTHCLGMCGGIAGALSAVGSAGSPTSPSSRTLARSLAGNLGRMSSYMAAGALVGATGSVLAGFAGAHGMLALRAVAALLVVAAGLYLAGWSGAVVRLELLGAALWRRLAPWAKSARETNTLLGTFGFGALWGWLPCGLVYSALAVAAASGSAAQGATVMAAFAVGTMPAMLAVGWAAGRWTSTLRSPLARRAAGTVVIGFGLWALAAAGLAYSRTNTATPACHEASMLSPGATPMVLARA